MTDNVGRYYITDGDLSDSASSEIPDLTGGKAVYEVIRVINGVPLFLEDHYERMQNSISNIGSKINFTLLEMAVWIKKTVHANGNSNCNTKIMSAVSDAGMKTLLYVSKSYYPDEATVAKGVKVGLLRLERKNPNIKIINRAYREEADKKIREGSFFETLLVSSDGSITEGSKSNVFFIMGERIFTAPGSQVLKGITRKYVFEACKSAGYEVEETLLNVDSLKNMDGLFLSGTSIKVLPVSCVEDLCFKSAANGVIQAVRLKYDELIKKYIDDNVKIW